MDIDKINEVVNIGLNHCHVADSIISVLAAFLAGLKAAGWSRDDVHAVEMGTLKILNGVATVKIYRDSTAVRAG